MHDHFENDSILIKKEKLKSRDLKKTRWWREKISKSPYCQYCNAKLSPNQITMDHIVPVSRGGKTTKNNIAISCKDCNFKKRSISNIDWFLKKYKSF